MALLRLTLLGGFGAALLPSGKSLSLPTRKAQALLAYCAVPVGKVHPRDKLASLLWGNRADAQARNSLRQTLHILKSVVPSEFSGQVFRIEGDTIAMDPQAVDVDVTRFEQLAAEGTPPALEKAGALYQGELVDGLLVDEEPFESWLLQERDRLRDMAMEALAQLLRHQYERRLTDAAIHTARRLLVLDPLQEVSHRTLMRLLVETGRREEALRQYEVCIGLLKKELHVGPEPATETLREEILKAHWPAIRFQRPLKPAGPPTREAHQRQLLVAKRECERASKLSQDIARSRMLLAKNHMLLQRGFDEATHVLKTLNVGPAVPERRLGPPTDGGGSASA